MTNLNELAEEIYKNSEAHGWWEQERNFGEALALIHSEVSEALEEWRKGKGYTEVYWQPSWSGDDVVRNKPEGIPIELADVIIRVLDLCGGLGIDIDTAVQEKMAYNKDRPFRHGGKLA